MKILSTSVAIFTAAIVFPLFVSKVQATTLYANNIGDLNQSNDRIVTIQPNGAISSSFVKPAGNADIFGGIAVVGNDLYYTKTNQNQLYKTDLAGNLKSTVDTRINNPAVLAWDGSAFWIPEAIQNINQISRVGLDGNTIRNISLANSTGGIGGLEFFNNKLIASPALNQTIFSIYDLDGNILQDRFINTTGHSTQTRAIAYNGSNFYVANSTGGKIDIYNGLTGLYDSSISLQNNGKPYNVADISFDYANLDSVSPNLPIVPTTPTPLDSIGSTSPISPFVSNVGGTQVPEPGTIIGTLIGGLVMIKLKIKTNKKAISN